MNMNLNKMILIAVIILNGCGIKKENSHKESPDEKRSGFIDITKEQFELVGMKVGHIEQRNLKEVVRANGYLKVPPQNQASVSAVLCGIIRMIIVKDGDFVRQGQVLATLEHPDYIKLQEEFATTKSNFSFAEKEYARQKELQTDNAGTAKIFQQTEANYYAEKARMESLKKQAELLGISEDEIVSGRFIKSIGLRSPIDGYISRIDAKIGTMAEPGKPLFEIIDNSKVHVDLFVYEKDLFKVKIGQRVYLTLTNQNNREIEGTVFSVNKSFENENKSVIVHAEIKNSASMNLIQGMYVTALISVKENKVPSVPEEAVVHSDGRDFIFVTTEEKAEPNKGVNEREETREIHGEAMCFQMIEVKTGVSDLGFIEITALQPLPDSSNVVVKETFFLLSKTKEGEGNDEH